MSNNTLILDRIHYNYHSIFMKSTSIVIVIV
jgi:hypothetical protein